MLYTSYLPPQWSIDDLLKELLELYDQFFTWNVKKNGGGWKIFFTWNLRKMGLLGKCQAGLSKFHPSHRYKRCVHWVLLSRVQGYNSSCTILIAATSKVGWYKIFPFYQWHCCKKMRPNPSFVSQSHVFHRTICLQITGCNLKLVFTNWT